MALSSQVAHAGRGPRRGVYRRRRRRRGPWLLVLLVLSAGGVLFWWMSGKEAGESDSAGPVEAGAAQGEARGEARTPERPPGVARARTGRGAEASSASNGDASAPGRQAAAAEEEREAGRGEGGRGGGGAGGGREASASLNRRSSRPASGAADAGPHSNAEAQVTATETMRRGLARIDAGEVIAGRRILSRLLTEAEDDLTPASARRIRRRLAEVNEELIFSSAVRPDDPLVATHTVAPGDLLSRIAPKYDVPYPLIERVNGVEARRIRVGQTLKIIRGPFHARVEKSAYRLDLFLEDPAEGQWIYVKSLPVGLGEEDSTPAGRWVVRPGSKLENPAWTHPRTGEVYGRDDPENPIGDYWIGLEGIDSHTESLRGYGIHGTIDPDSIGTQASMGCVRLAGEDIRLLYDVLAPGQSRVIIRP